MNDKKDFFSGIASKLSILMGTAVLVTSAQASTTATSSVQAESNGITMQAVGVRKPFPAKLTLKRQNTGFKLIALTDRILPMLLTHSHSSHSSRAS